MKKFLPFIIGICSSQLLLSQIYYPIPADSVYWVEVETSSDGGSCTYYTYRYIYPVGNIVIQGNTYTEFRVDGITEFVPIDPPWICSSNQNFTNQFYAFIRNDIVNKKVYLYDTISLHQDIMIYDFNVFVGDTVNPTSGVCACSAVCPYDTFVVGNIDSVNIAGEYRKRFGIIKTTVPGADTIYMIEGIGSNLGFAFNYYCPVEISTNLVCYHYKNLSYIPASYIGSPHCTTTLGVPNTNDTKDNFIIPFGTNAYYIKNEESSLIEIIGYDILGKFIFKNTFHESGYIEFTGIPSGIYFIYIIYNGQIIQPYKFTIQH